MSVKCNHTHKTKGQQNLYLGSLLIYTRLYNVLPLLSEIIMIFELSFGLTDQMVTFFICFFICKNILALKELT